MIGIGTDILQMQRIEEVIERQGERFVNRILTPAEQLEYAASKRANHLLAKRFAAKEACAKALGTGVPRRGVHWKMMEVVNLPSGKPTLNLTDGALQRLQEITPEGLVAHVHLTMTDDHPWAEAQVIIEALPA